MTSEPEENAPVDPEERFELFLFEMDDALEALASFVHELGRRDLEPLDYSIESVDRAERLYSLYLEGQISPDVSDDIFTTRLARYLGETLRKRVGGRWTLTRDEKYLTVGLPGITAIPGAHESYIWTPHAVISNFKVRREEGLLRRALESNLDLRR